MGLNELCTIHQRFDQHASVHATQRVVVWDTEDKAHCERLLEDMDAPERRRHEKKLREKLGKPTARMANNSRIDQFLPFEVVLVTQTLQF